MADVAQGRRDADAGIARLDVRASWANACHGTTHRDLDCGHWDKEYQADEESSRPSGHSRLESSDQRRNPGRPDEWNATSDQHRGELA